MANLVFVTPEAGAKAYSFKCNAADSFSGGAALALDSDSRKVSGSYITRRAPAGVSAFEKDNLDGSTRCTVYRHDIIVDVTASGAIPMGGTVILSGANKVAWLNADPLSGSNPLLMQSYKFGTCLELASDGEVVEVEVDCA